MDSWSRKRKRWYHWATKWEYYLPYAHNVDPAKPCGLKGVSHSLPISLTHRSTHSILLMSSYLMCPLSTWSFAKKENCRNCLLGQHHCVSTAHSGKQDQCHCWDFLICSCCCCRTTGASHSSSNYCHLFTGIVLEDVSPLVSRWFYHPRGSTSVLQHSVVLVQLQSWAITDYT